MARELHIETFEWKGQIRYKCPEAGCPFDTYTLNGREGMLFHIANSHRASAKANADPLPPPKLFDASGKELEPEKPIVGGDDVSRLLKKQGLADAEVHLYADDPEKVKRVKVEQGLEIEQPIEDLTEEHNTPWFRRTE